MRSTDSGLLPAKFEKRYCACAAPAASDAHSAATRHQPMIPPVSNEDAADYAAFRAQKSGPQSA